MYLPCSVRYAIRSRCLADFDAVHTPDFCQQSSIPLPEFGSEAVANETGSVEHKVWLIIGTERMELPTKFSSLTNGQERLAKTVLARLRGTSKKRKTELE